MSLGILRRLVKKTRATVASMGKKVVASVREDQIYVTGRYANPRDR
jgi:hypothetical protein